MCGIYKHHDGMEKISFLSEPEWPTYNLLVFCKLQQFKKSRIKGVTLFFSEFRNESWGQQNETSFFWQ